MTASDCVGPHFGYSVSISGNTIIVGSSYGVGQAVDSGAAYIYYFDATNWVVQQTLLASDGAVSDQFGYSVSISDTYAIIGDIGDPENGTMSGAAYIIK